MSDEFESQLDRIEALVRAIFERQQVKDWYNVEEFAKLVGLAPFTVRQYCRQGRLKAHGRSVQRGRGSEWALSHEEYLRYQRQGLLPLAKPVA